jgi:hypothetical protein
MTTVFRALLVISTILYIVGFWLVDFRFELYKPEWYDLLRWDGYDAKIGEYPVWIDYVLFAITVAVSAMLYFFVGIARQIYLFLVIFYALSAFIWGVRVYAPIEQFIWGLVAMSDGALLTMIYFTSIAQRFNKSAAQQGVPADRPRPAARPAAEHRRYTARGNSG